ncbi:MAG: hypothetical protein ABIF92_00100 [archaeon]
MGVPKIRRPTLKKIPPREFNTTKAASLLRRYAANAATKEEKQSLEPLLIELKKYTKKSGKSSSLIKIISALCVAAMVFSAMQASELISEKSKKIRKAFTEGTALYVSTEDAGSVKEYSFSEADVLLDYTLHKTIDAQGQTLFSTPYGELEFNPAVFVDSSVPGNHTFAGNTQIYFKSAELSDVLHNGTFSIGFFRDDLKLNLYLNDSFIQDLELEPFLDSLRNRTNLFDILDLKETAGRRLYSIGVEPAKCIEVTINTDNLTAVNDALKSFPLEHKYPIYDLGNTTPEKVIKNLKDSVKVVHVKDMPALEKANSTAAGFFIDYVNYEQLFFLKHDKEITNNTKDFNSTHFTKWARSNGLENETDPYKIAASITKYLDACYNYKPGVFVCADFSAVFALSLFELQKINPAAKNMACFYTTGMHKDGSGSGGHAWIKLISVHGDSLFVTHIDPTHAAGASDSKNDFYESLDALDTEHFFYVDPDTAKAETLSILDDFYRSSWSKDEKISLALWIGTSAFAAAAAAYGLSIARLLGFKTLMAEHFKNYKLCNAFKFQEKSKRTATILAFSTKKKVKEKYHFRKKIDGNFVYFIFFRAHSKFLIRNRKRIKKLSQIVDATFNSLDLLVHGKKSK